MKHLIWVTDVHLNFLDLAGVEVFFIDLATLEADGLFTFRFADDRIIPCFHLEGIKAGRPVSIFKMDPRTGERRDDGDRGRGLVSVFEVVGFVLSKNFVKIAHKPPRIEE